MNNDKCPHCGTKAGEPACDWIECNGRTPSPQVADIAELPKTWQERRNADRLQLNAAGLDSRSLPLIRYMQAEIGDLRAIAASRRAAGGEVYGYHYEWASCITAEGPRDFRWKFDREAPPVWAVEEGQARNVTPLCKIATPVPASAGQAELCPSCKGHSEGVGTDGVENDCHACFVRDHKAWLAARGAGQAGQVADQLDSLLTIFEQGGITKATVTAQIYRIMGATERAAALTEAEGLK